MPEDPLFTYEQAVHHRRGRTDFLLVMGVAIPTEERVHLSESTITELSKKQTDVEAHDSLSCPVVSYPKDGTDGDAPGP